MKFNNPFLTRGYKSPQYFCNREVETARIINAVNNNRNVTLFSQRRIGKTGLIEHVFYKLNKEKKYSLFYLDILPTTNLNEFLNQLGKSLIGKLDSTTEKIIRKFGNMFKGLGPIINFDSLTGQPSIQFNIRAEADFENTLDGIFNYLSGQKNEIVIAIDEFQQIINYPEKNVEALLRTYVNKANNINFIFSGSIKHLLISMFADHGRPFYQSSELLSLGKINQNKYRNFIQNKFIKSNFQINEEEILYILDWTRNHTYYVQYVCNKLYSRNIKNVNSNIINETLYEILKENETVYVNYRNLLTEYQWNVLKAIAKERKVKKITSKDFIFKYNLNATSSVKTAIKALIEKEMIYFENDYYYVADVFFERWLERL